MDLNQFVTFLDAINDPVKYQEKLKVLQDQEAAVKAAYETKAKADQIDSLYAEAQALLEKAKKDAEQVKSAAQDEAASFVRRSKEALAEAEKLKSIANDKAKEAREKMKTVQDAQTEIDTQWAQMAEKQKAMNESMLVQSSMQQEIEARLSKLRAAMQ